MYTTGWVIKKVGTDKFYSGSVKGGIFTGIYSSKIYQKYENAVKALKKCQDRYLTECQICTVKLSIEIASKCDTCGYATPYFDSEECLSCNNYENWEIKK